MDDFTVYFPGGLRSLLVYLNAVLLTFGLWRLFPKCGVKKQVALIPFYRLYKLAQAADAEDAGIILGGVSLLVRAAPILENIFIDYLQRDNVLLAFIGILAALSVVLFIYKFRVFWAVCNLFQKRKAWMFLWLFASAIPAFIWGRDSKVLPAYEPSRQTTEAAPVSGMEAAVSDEGLTVNLEKRTTFEQFRKKTLLRDIHMNIRPGRMVLLLGGSGAGKTTLVNAIIGYEKADAKVLLNGKDVYKNYDSLKYEISLVPQQDLIRYDDTVLRTLTDAAVLRLPENVSTKQLRQRVNEVLNIFGLTSQKHEEVEKMSGGQKKRLSIAMEYISNPYLFVLDEPDSGLDGVLARDLMTRLRAISREGKIVLVITHSPDRVLDLFDDVIVLAKDANKTGRLVFFGPVDEAKKFFGVNTMEEVVKQVNRVDEGGAGRADELIEKFMEVNNGKQV